MRSLSIALAVVFFIAGCDDLPSLEARSTSSLFTDTRETALGKSITARTDAHPGASGIHPLPDANDAFAARMLLARTAERSLDLQYYIWRNDLTGTMLFEALHAAAGRGVRVRLLLDDNNTDGLDPTLAALDAHPSIEVRLFNPFANRRMRWLGYLTDFTRLNRRMHNKSFTADNQTTIVGGRNVGDGYFGATDGVLFADLDVLAIGPVVASVSEDFDRYWRSASAYPVASLLPRANAAQLEYLPRAAALIESEPAARAYVDAVRRSPFVATLLRGELAFEWAPTVMISDDPAKGLGKPSREALLVAELRQVIGSAKSELDIVSPYFVPTESGVAALSALAARGVRLRVLTNALEATDVAVVHAGYAKYRLALLKAGIELYELRSSGIEGARVKAKMFGGSSGSSLHAKTFAADRARAFVGSFNFDPRSRELNTELGFVIESPVIARAIAHRFDTEVPNEAYRVALTDHDEIVWIEQSESGPVTHRSEPGSDALLRGWIGFLGLLPIEWML